MLKCMESSFIYLYENLEIYINGLVYDYSLLKHLILITLMFQFSNRWIRKAL